MGPDQYFLESGYAFTVESCRGQGISSKLLAYLLDEVKENVYATTKDENHSVHRVLQKNDFIKLGNLYKSERGDYFLQLWVLNKSL